MKWVCLGLNYRTAPVEIREKFVVPDHRVEEEGGSLREIPGLEGCVFLSTCNRMEIYVSMSRESSREVVANWLLSRHGMPGEMADHFYYKEAGDAAGHLCRVLSGLDSMVLGETEILGQVKKAYSLALAAGLTDGYLNKLFQKAFSIGKKVRTHTSINKGATSIGSVAVDLAGEIFGNLSDTKVMILGAGEMSRVTAQSLQSRGASGIFVANRTYDRAVELAGQMGGEAIRYDQWAEYLKKVDIVVASTAAPHYIVSPEDILPLRAARKYRPLFFIDISVPRNVDPLVGDIDEVYLYDIDTLSALADEARTRRTQAIRDCESIIEQELSLMTMNTALPQLVVGTRGSALALAQAKLVSTALEQKYPGMRPERKIIKTTGDIRTDVPLAQVAEASGIVDKGVFIKELENALLTGEIDLAVHSLKDMPSVLDDRFRIAAVLPRNSTRDVIISKRGEGDSALPPNAVVATSSVRRKFQIMTLRPDVTVVDIRGNVPTRLDKLSEHGEWDAILLAEAGLNRLGLTAEELLAREVPLYVTPLEPTEFLPAAGQGAVALEIRADNSRIADLLAPLNSPETEQMVRAEREFLKLLEAGCSTPVGVHTYMEGELLTLKAVIYNEEEPGIPPVSVQATGFGSKPEAVAEEAFRKLP